MSRLFKAFPSAFITGRVHSSQLENGEVETYSTNWNGVLGALGTTASTSAWATEQSGVITIGTPAIASGVATVPITAIGTGCAVITNTLTMADASKREQKFLVEVVDTR